ncbi:MAG: DeoR family transcriptional regulator [Bacteroidaceae bacterium]|nr:DeoR family transcriptional regulator [Bacteroidaceae bacterium]MBQ2167267.1 DeoR family transcriptional regulator [Bacteroidaceae bacterium]
MLDLIKSDDLITIHQMTQKINVSEKTIKRELAFLQEKGILTREGGRKEGKWVILIEE